MRGADSRVGGLTVDCNTRTHEGALQSEAPFSAQRWYASGAVFMPLRKAKMQSEEAERECVGFLKMLFSALRLHLKSVAGSLFIQFRRGPRQLAYKQQSSPKATRSPPACRDHSKQARGTGFPVAFCPMLSGGMMIELIVESCFRGITGPWYHRPDALKCHLRSYSCSEDGKASVLACIGAVYGCSA